MKNGAKNKCCVFNFVQYILSIVFFVYCVFLYIYIFLFVHIFFYSYYPCLNWSHSDCALEAYVTETNSVCLSILAIYLNLTLQTRGRTSVCQISVDGAVSPPRHCVAVLHCNFNFNFECASSHAIWTGAVQAKIRRHHQQEKKMEVTPLH